MSKLSISQFVDFVVDVLIDIPYPSDYEVSNNWKKYLDELLFKARSSTEEEIISLGMNCGYFDNKTDRVVNYYKDIHEVVGASKLNTILEIGAGFGSTAKFMKSLGTKCYIIVDLPEALIFSYAFLNSKFPKSNVKIIAHKDGAKIDKNYDFVFCPVQLFQYLQIDSVDLFISTYSLGEVPQKSLDYLIHHVERLSPRFFYSENLIFTDKTLHYDAGEEQANEIVLKLQPRWFPLLFKLDSQGVVNKGKMNHRFIGHVGLIQFNNEFELLSVLKRIVESIMNAEGQVEELLKYLYFLALWDTDYIQFFVLALDNFCKQYCPDIDIQKIGEVKFLMRDLDVH